MADNSKTEYIYNLIREIRYCSLANAAGDRTIDVRIMTFSCSEDLKSFYMLSPRHAKKVKEFVGNRSATLLAYTLTKDLDDFLQVVVKGTVRIHLEIHTPALKKGLLALAGKLDIPAEKLANGIPEDCVFLELKPKEIELTEYKDIMHKIQTARITF